VATTDEELSQLEKDIRQLQIEYDTYFSGGRPRPPSDTEFRVQRNIKRLAEMQGRLKYAERFRYNTIASRYAKYSEVWRQRARKVETGHSAYSYSKTARDLEQKRLEESEKRQKIRKAVGTRIALRDPKKDTEQVQALYKTMVEAKKAAGEGADINFEQFTRFVRQKTSQLRKQMHCESVQYEVSVEGGHVKLKAKGV
jgi:hypothetical protein